MKKIVLVFKNFFPTLKKYINYLMNVGYKELFINTVIIFCLIILSAFVYIPINVVQDFIFDTIQLFGSFTGIGAEIYFWFFKLLSAICAILFFMWLFNKRFESIKNGENAVLEGKEKKKVKNNEKIESFDLPKAKKQ